MECEKNREYYKLVKKARELVSLDSSADQVIVVETEKSNMYHFANHLYVDGHFVEKSEDEEKFVQMLINKGESALKYIVCMWNENSIDLPTMHFRKLLMDISEKNADTMLVLQSIPDVILKRLSDCMPSPTEKIDGFMLVNSDKTRQYYGSLKPEDLCDCDYCINYYSQIKKV